MVGVSGRSKGCNTCRKRKIRCDLGKPRCSQCIKSNRTCTGYQRPTVFIVNQGYTPKIQQSSMMSKDNSNTAKAIPYRHRDKDSSLTLKTRDEKKPVKYLPETTKFDVISQAPAYRVGLYHAYLYQTMPRTDLSLFRHSHWLLQIANVSQPTEALATSILALSLAKFGHSNKDPIMLRESNRIYTQAIHELQLSLWNDYEMYRDETLAACMTLAFYEVVECPTKTKYGYISHHNGCAKLIELRGAKAHSTGLGHAIFTAFRAQGILQALEAHRPSFLTEPVWMELPWAYEPKSNLDRMWDFFSIAPGILRKADAFPTLNAYDSLVQALELHEECLELDRRLQHFYQELEADTPGPLYWPELSTQDNPADCDKLGKVFPVSFHFSNLSSAYTFLLYWAICTMLWHGQGLLREVILSTSIDRKSLPPRDETPAILLRGISPCDSTCACKSNQIEACVAQYNPNEVPLGSHKNDYMIAVRNVCQSVEFCMQREMLDQGPMLLVAPLSIAAETIRPYPQNARELAWTVAVMQRIEERSLPALRYFADLKPPESVKPGD